MALFILKKAFLMLGFSGYSKIVLSSKNITYLPFFCVLKEIGNKTGILLLQAFQRAFL
jgi:CRISPR/Cas system-associated protein endoribonuclease Cas2